MKKKKEKKKKREKTGPVQLSKVCLCESEVLLYFSSTHLICPVIKMFITQPDLSSASRNLSLLYGQLGSIKDCCL